MAVWRPGDVRPHFYKFADVRFISSPYIYPNSSTNPPPPLSLSLGFTYVVIESKRSTSSGFEVTLSAACSSSRLASPHLSRLQSSSWRPPPSSTGPPSTRYGHTNQSSPTIVTLEAFFGRQRVKKYVNETSIESCSREAEEAAAVWKSTMRKKPARKPDGEEETSSRLQNCRPDWFFLWFLLLLLLP